MPTSDPRGHNHRQGTSALLLYELYMPHGFVGLISFITVFFCVWLISCSEMFKSLSHFLPCTFYSYLSL